MDAGPHPMHGSNGISLGSSVQLTADVRVDQQTVTQSHRHRDHATAMTRGRMFTDYNNFRDLI